jgi:hypothetical protein
MVRRGGLERLRDGRLVSYRPTPRTVALLKQGDRRIFSLGREPHRAELWTALWHAIPQERRLERGGSPDGCGSSAAALAPSAQRHFDAVTSAPSMSDQPASLPTRPVSR